MSDAFSVSIEPDAGSMASVSRAANPDMYRKIWDTVAKDATLLGESAAKEVTPVVTGHARRSSVSDTKRFEVQGRYPYVNWLDTGRTAGGRRMSARPDGYRIRDQVRERVETSLPRLFDRAGREIADRWGG